MKKVVLFGAGLVSPPFIRYVLDSGFQLTVASLPEPRIEEVLNGHPNGRSVTLDVHDDGALREQVAGADVAVSLLPATLHPRVARACIDQGVHMVTTSYVSPEMAALDAAARAKGVLLLNELGVDPGVDHMSAMAVIHAEQRAGGTLVGFSSWCGGLPAPEANNNPLGYKFSWSPRAVLVAGNSPARYLVDGTIVDIPASEIFADPAAVDIPSIGVLEGYPNRDSVAYLDAYGLDPSQVKSMFRGTLRYPGFCGRRIHLSRLGLFAREPERDLAGMTCRSLMEELFGAPLDETIPAKLGVPAAQAPLEALEYLGLFGDEPVGIDRGSMVDVMAHHMERTMVYQPGERDMVVMRHDLTFEYDGGTRRECVTAIMVDFGQPKGDSSMARTVSLPAAIGTRMILEDKIEARGVQIPIDPDLYEAALAELESLGISFTETRTVL